MGFSRDMIIAGMQETAIKERIVRANEEAIANGVFGSPCFLAGGEPFWGSDRLRPIVRQ